jgi:hypothetical protein
MMAGTAAAAFSFKGYYLEHDSEKACPGHLIRGGCRFSEKIMLHQ